MSQERLAQLAEAAGLISEWEDSEGSTHQLDAATQRALLAGLGYPAESNSEMAQSLERLRSPTAPGAWPPLITADQGEAIPLPSPLPHGTHYQLALEHGEYHEGELDGSGTLPAITTPGYHRLQIADAELTLAVAPPRCHSVADACAESAPRRWGLTLQLYALRRPGDGGIGDTQALTQFIRHAAQNGATAVAVSPAHAMFSADVTRYAPYSPSSRLHYNVLHAAPATLLGQQAVDRAIASSGVGETLARCERDTLLDWPAAAGAKLTWLRTLYDDLMLREDSKAQQVHQALRVFREQGGTALEDHCRFEALQQRLDIVDWRQWPQELQEPSGQEVARFAEVNTRDVEFHAFLQWLTSAGLAQAQAAALQAGMSIGLIADLAVGVDAAGSQVWSRQAEMLDGLSIGAPPDAFNPHGQHWGLAPFSPQGLVRTGFRSFIDMLRAGFAHAGGLRIDHVLGLMRLWLIPHGAPPTAGGYVRYPLDDLLRLVTLESWRHRAIVIGEDLGTVPPGLRQRLEQRGILGLQVLWFERDTKGDFLPPTQWSPGAVATSSTHDLPTLAGWWAGRDIEWRHRLGLLGEGQSVIRERENRRCERKRLAPTPNAHEFPASPVLDVCVRRLGLTPAPLALLPVEDALGLEEQANLPGTQEAHPNWRRRLPEHAARLLAAPLAKNRLRILAEARREASQSVQGGRLDA